MDQWICLVICDWWWVIDAYLCLCMYFCLWSRVAHLKYNQLFTKYNQLLSWTTTKTTEDLFDMKNNTSLHTICQTETPEAGYDFPSDRKECLTGQEADRKKSLSLHEMQHTPTKLWVNMCDSFNAQEGWMWCINQQEQYSTEESLTSLNEVTQSSCMHHHQHLSAHVHEICSDTNSSTWC